MSFFLEKASFIIFVLEEIDGVRRSKTLALEASYI